MIHRLESIMSHRLSRGRGFRFLPSKGEGQPDGDFDGLEKPSQSSAWRMRGSMWTKCLPFRGPSVESAPVKAHILLDIL